MLVYLLPRSLSGANQLQKRRKLIEKLIKIDGRASIARPLHRSKFKRSWSCFEPLVKWQLLVCEEDEHTDNPAQTNHYTYPNDIPSSFSLLMYLKFQHYGKHLLLLPLLRTLSLVSLVESTDG